MRVGTQHVRVAWLGTLCTRPKLRRFALKALKAVDDENVHALRAALVELIAASEHSATKDLAQGLIDLLDREVGS